MHGISRRRATAVASGALLLLTLLPASALAIPIGPAAKLAFGVQPSNTAAGGTISSVTVQVQDANGSVVTTDGSSVTLAIGTNPGGGTLNGTLTQTASGGVATFSNLSITNAGIGYRLTATDGALTGTTSAAFTIIGPAAKLAFGVQPSNTAAGGTISSVTVQVQDANGSVVTTDGSSVTLAIGTNPGGGTLNGTLTQTASGGVATFSNLSITNAGIGYRLTATDGALTGTTSAAFTIIGPAAKLAFGVQPSNTAAGGTISSVTVQVQDANGSVVTTDGSSVTLAIGTNPGGGTLNGTLTQTASGGVATFSNLSITNAGIGYRLTATDGALTGTTSAAFTIIGPAAKLAFGVQPSNTAAGGTISSVTVQVQDANGSVVTTDGSSVTLAIGTNPGGGTLNGTLTQTASGGVATFSNLSITNAGIGYRLTATDGALTGTTSAAFTITTTNYLYFATQPGGGPASAIWSAQAVVDVVDSLNRVVTTDNSTVVTLAISTNPASGTLSCTSGTSRTVVNGVASFYGCSINIASTSYYTLTATSSPAWTPATSGAFYIGGSEALVFATQPAGGTAGAIWSGQPVVEVVNSSNQIVTTDNSTIVYLGVGTNPAGGTLSCTGGTTEQVVNGVATFSGCSINIASTSYYTLTATSSPAWTPATSGAFYIGGSEALVFATQPAGGTAGAIWSGQPVVEVVNSSNQIVTTDNSTIVYLGVGTNPAGGTLSCTGGTTEQVVNGVATFSGCSINIASTSYYTLTATSSPAWTPATSGAFYVTGTRPVLAISASSAIGLKPASGFSSTTPKTQATRKFVTWKFNGGSALAGQRVNVLVATRVGSTWGKPRYYKSAWADANGVVTFTWTRSSAGAINVRAQLYGSATYGVSTSLPLGAYWK